MRQDEVASLKYLPEGKAFASQGRNLIDVLWGESFYSNLAKCPVRDKILVDSRLNRQQLSRQGQNIQQITLNDL